MPSNHCILRTLKLDRNAFVIHPVAGGTGDRSRVFPVGAQLESLLMRRDIDAPLRSFIADRVQPMDRFVAGLAGNGSVGLRISIERVLVRLINGEISPALAFDKGSKVAVGTVRLARGKPPVLASRSPVVWHSVAFLCIPGEELRVVRAVPGCLHERCTRMFSI